MRVKRGVEADGGGLGAERGWKYRSLSYRLVKNYGPRPTVFRRIAGHALGDAYAELRAVFGGESKPSQWFGSGRTVLTNVGGGARDGLAARRKDREERRNPNGRSTRADRAVAVYDWRE